MSTDKNLITMKTVSTENSKLTYLELRQRDGNDKVAYVLSYSLPSLRIQQKVAMQELIKLVHNSLATQFPIIDFAYDLQCIVYTKDFQKILYKYQLGLVNSSEELSEELSDWIEMEKEDGDFVNNEQSIEAFIQSTEQDIYDCVGWLSPNEIVELIRDGLEDHQERNRDNMYDLADKLTIVMARMKEKGIDKKLLEVTELLKDDVTSYLNDDKPNEERIHDSVVEQEVLDWLYLFVFYGYYDVYGRI